jgi:hypothetical protein
MSHHDFHPTSSFLFPGMPMIPGQAPVAGAQTSIPGQPPAGTQPASGYQGDQVKPIDPNAEITRITGNIWWYNASIALGSIGIALSTCFFVKSIYRPAKGYHGGDSDSEMDTDDDDDDDDDDEESEE